jgi:hypothetical protein
MRKPCQASVYNMIKLSVLALLADTMLCCCCCCAAAVVPLLQYTAGSPGYKALHQGVQDWEHQPKNPAGRLFYLALPPYVYPEVRGGRRCSGKVDAVGGELR